MRCITMKDMDTQITVRISEHLAAALEVAALRSGLKRSDLVRLALQSYLGEQPQETGTAYERVKDLIGKATHSRRDERDSREVIIERIRKHAKRPS
jgi:metal-responsive CopG/Arc/MetJ family transcriptional regulator